MTGTPERRIRNPKGQGARLRSEILAAARTILERTGTEEALTLRAIARAVGVSPPAIYAHFADREQIVEAVIGAAFAEFASAIRVEIEGVGDPVTRLHRGCRAYVRYGTLHPATYRVLFTRHHPSRLPSVAAAAAETFQLLVDTIEECAQSGCSESTDPRSDAVGLWLGLHGLTALPPSHPRFPWPDPGVLLDQLLVRLAAITAPLPPPEDTA